MDTTEDAGEGLEAKTHPRVSQTRVKNTGGGIGSMHVYQVQAFNKHQASQVSLRCPSCHQQGTFEPVDLADLWIEVDQVKLGQRRCPNPACFAHLFVVIGPTGGLVAAYPPERIDFDATNLPTEVLKALEEAITCHANECYTAAAIMVRKSMEELCRDRNAQGANLKDRIKDLGTKIVIPKELFDGLDDIRLLGNDAAHVESQVFEQVGPDEVEIGMEFTKEVLKAVYQYTALLARLQALKKDSSGGTL